MERFRDAIERGASRGPNFAGHYTLISRSCGRLCQEFVIVDAVDGRVFPGLSDAPPFEFRLDSRLIAFEPPTPMTGRIACAGCTAAYYVWRNDVLELVPPETWVGSAPPPPAIRPLVDSLRTSERSRLSGPAVTRPTWDRLIIATRDGTRQVFQDRLEGDVRVALHAYQSWYRSIDQHLIEVIGVGSSSFLLVDAATGRTTELDAPPVVSPNGTRFVTTSTPVRPDAAGRMRIYRLDAFEAVIEWSMETAAWHGTDAVWLNDTTITVERVPNGNARVAGPAHARITATPDGWVVGFDAVSLAAFHARAAR